MLDINHFSLLEVELNFPFVIRQAERARMELERELDDLNERLEEQGGATQAQVCLTK